MSWKYISKRGWQVVIPVLFMLHQIYGATIFSNESFESSFPPTGWEETQEQHWQITASHPHTGSSCAVHPWDTDENSYLITPVINLSGYTNIQLIYWEYLTYSEYCGADDYHYIKISSDKSTWTVLSSTVNTDAEGSWKQRTISLSAYTGNIYIAFHYLSTEGAEWYIDDVSVTGDVAPNIVFVNGGNAALDFHQTPAGNPLPDTDWLCGQFSLTGDATGATLNSITVFLSGTYDPGDLSSTPFQIYASNTNNFATSSALGSSMADPGSGSDLTFTGLNDAIPASIRYYWVTADISASATSDDTMNGTVDAAGDLSITGGVVSGSSAYGKLNAGTDASLPVTLSLFSARQVGTSVILEWKTESEFDHRGFILERLGPDGRWICIADYQTNPSLAGEGNNSTGREYFIEDEDVSEGVMTYRLIEVSIDGDEEEISRIHIDVDGAPQMTELKPAVPNPFNPSTQIYYDLSEESLVRITVYDLSGRIVKTLIPGKMQQPGSYNIYWNGNTENGVSVSTGTYLVVMDTGEYRKVQKVMMLK